MLWASSYHIIILLTGVSRWGLISTPVSYIHLAARCDCTWGWCLKDTGKKPCWKCKRLDWIPLLQCLKSWCCCCFCTSQAWASPTKDCFCWLLWALGDWYVLLAIPAVSEKFCSTFMLDITAVCFASVAGNVSASTDPWSYLLVSSFWRRSALHNWLSESLLAYCLAAC